MAGQGINRGAQGGNSPPLGETAISKAIELAIGSRRDARIWRNNSGMAFGKGRAVKFGITGQADLSGILSDGRRLELEVKKPGEGPTTEQADFGAMIERFGGVWAVVTSVDEAIAVVDRAMGIGPPSFRDKFGIPTRRLEP